MFAPQRAALGGSYECIDFTPAVGSSFGEYTMAIARMLDRMGVSSASIVGFSMGGMIAAELATTYPERGVERLAPAGSTVDPERPERVAVRAQRLAAARTSGVEKLAHEVLMPTYLPPSGKPITISSG